MGSRVSGYFDASGVGAVGVLQYDGKTIEFLLRMQKAEAIDNLKLHLRAQNSHKLGF